MEEKIHNSFNKHGFLKTIGAKIESIEHGKIVISCELTEELTQQHGFFHGGVLGTLGDTACGYAALSTKSEEVEVMGVEYKINFLRPAAAQKILAIGEVIKSGRTLIVTEGKITDESGETLFAKVMATIIVVQK